MTVKAVTATVECDGCAGTFRVDVDTALSSRTRIGQWSMFELVVDAVRAGLYFVEYVQPKRTIKPDEMTVTMVINDHHMCPRCVNALSAYKDLMEKRGDSDELKFMSFSEVMESALEEMEEQNGNGNTTSH